MCDPVTIMAATTVVSTAYKANQQIQQGKYQKGVADYNAAVAENQSQEVRNKGIEEENTQRRRTAEILSKQRAQFGAANVDLASGSALQLQEDTEALGEADALRIRSNYDKRVEAIQTGADFTRQQGEFAESAGNAAAFGTLLQGVSSFAGTGVADKWFTPNSAVVVGDPLAGVA